MIFDKILICGLIMMLTVVLMLISYVIVDSVNGYILGYVVIGGLVLAIFGFLGGLLFDFEVKRQEKEEE